MIVPDHMPQVEGVDSSQGIRIHIRLHQGADRRRISGELRAPDIAAH
jgi:hypothetical protein